MALTPQSLVNKSLELVSPPSTYARLDELIHDPDSAIDDISKVINTDPALTTRLLKIVNSPFYGFPSQINTISRAITVIGTRELTNLVLATSVVNAFTGIPKLSGEAIKSARFGHEVIYLAEQRVIGFDHTEAGEALIQAWRLPESLGFVARHHHTPVASGYASEVCIVHVADVMVSSVPFGHSGDQHVPPLDPVAWERLGLQPEVIPALLRKVAIQLDHLAANLL